MIDFKDIKLNVKKSLPDPRDYKTKLNPVGLTILPRKFDLTPNLPNYDFLQKYNDCSVNAGAICFAMWLGIKSMTFSRMFLYWQERNLEGTLSSDNGAYAMDICRALYKVGICEERFMPYTKTKLTDKPSVDAIKNASKYKIPNYIRLRNLQEIKQHIVETKQPVLLSITCFDSLFSDYIKNTGIIGLPLSNESEIGGHEILIIAFDDEKIITDKNGKKYIGCVKIKNSWGKWGENGKDIGFIPYDYFNAGYTWDYLCFQK